MEPDATGRLSLRSLAATLRVSQWTKNSVVLAAMFFALGDRSQQIPLAEALRVIPAALLFCLVSSGVYILNDIRDRDADRRHPVKRRRPIAAGQVSLPGAWMLAAVLLVLGLSGSAFLTPRFLLVTSGYVVLQLVYTFALKRLALVDIMVIASGFVLRALGGAVAIDDLVISPWLLVCTFLLALFLATCKRRHEKVVMEDSGTEDQVRESLGKYDRQLLDQLIAIVSAATIVCYAIYTLWPTTVEKFGTSLLGLTLPFVVFGMFRYLDLVYRHEKGDRPEKILLTDAPLLIDIGLYGLSLVVIFLTCRG